MIAHGWTLLPDQRGASIHRTGPDHDGYVLCGRPLDPRASVHADNPGFDACARCAVLAGEPLPGEGFPAGTAAAGRAGRQRPTSTPIPAPRRPPELPGKVDDDEAQVGWVRLPGRLLHRADPANPDRVVCGKPLPVGVKVYARPPQEGGWSPCKTCASTLPLRLATARKRGLLNDDRAAKARKKARPVQQPVELSGGELLRAWRRVGWVVLADGRRAHHPHPQRPGQVLCGRVLDPAISVQRQQPKVRPCQRCSDVLRREQENHGIRTIVISSPEDVDRYERGRSRSSSVRAVRGGLPTLGRDR